MRNIDKYEHKHKMEKRINNLEMHVELLQVQVRSIYEFVGSMVNIKEGN